MSERTTVALVGIGGYATNYVTELLDRNVRGNAVLLAAVEPFPAGSARLGELTAAGIPIYATLEQMYTRHSPDLIVISSPIHYHCAQTVIALQHGSHVLCEKPVCATLDQVDQMIAARDLAKRQVAIGYQWPFSPTFQSLKADIRAGVLGAPRRLSTLVCWPRDDGYYRRNRWAGRKHTEIGEPVFDSPVNNACSHYLQIMFYVLGSKTDESAVPHAVTAELYRANPIENYDTAAIRCVADSNTEVLFLASHTTARLRGPVFRYEFEKAVVTFDQSNPEGVVATFGDGTTKAYGAASDEFSKLWSTIDAIRCGGSVLCGIEAAAAQTIVMTAAQERAIVQVPSSIVHPQPYQRGTSLVVDGLDDALDQCYREHKLPSELGIEWMKPNPLANV